MARRDFKSSTVTSYRSDEYPCVTRTSEKSLDDQIEDYFSDYLLKGMVVIENTFGKSERVDLRDIGLKQ